MNKYYIHTFKTDYGPYLYDVTTNNILPITNNIYNYLNNDNIEVNDEIKQFISDSKEKGMFGNWPTEIKYFMSDKTLNYCLNNTLLQLALSVTENCNLNCKYCCYDWKRNENYSQKIMSKEIAFKAIDIFINNSKNSPVLFLSFYGGEPLLNFNLIKLCVEYIKHKVRGQKLIFNMTTNATLLTEEIEKFLVDNDFGLLISLDGPKSINDRYRINKNSIGSYNSIINNLKSFRNKYPIYFDKHVRINSVLAPPVLADKLEYFIFGSPIKVSLSKMLGGEDVIKDLSDEDLLKSQNIYPIMLNEYRYNNFEIHSSLLNGFIRIYQLKYTINNNSNSCFPVGACIPGVRRMYVNADGKIYPCEKVNEANNNYIIGDVEKGIDISLVKNLINWYIDSLDSKCIKCWAINLCGSCFQNADISSEEKNKLCEQTRLSREKTLIDYINITKEKPEIFNKLSNLEQ